MKTSRSRRDVARLLRVDAPSQQPDEGFVAMLAELADSSGTAPPPLRAPRNAAHAKIAAAAASVALILSGIVYAVEQGGSDAPTPGPTDRGQTLQPATPSGPERTPESDEPAAREDAGGPERGHDAMGGAGQHGDQKPGDGGRAYDHRPSGGREPAKDDSGVDPGGAPATRAPQPGDRTEQPADPAPRPDDPDADNPTTGSGSGDADGADQSDSDAADAREDAADARQDAAEARQDAQEEARDAAADRADHEEDRDP